MKRIVAIALVLVLVSPRTALAVPGADEALLSSILAENVKQSVDISAQLNNLRQIIQTARDNYELARATYAVAEGLKTWDTNLFLEDSRREFMASNPVFYMGDSLARDISKNGLRGGDVFLIRTLARADLYRNAQRMQDCECSYEGHKLVEWKGGDPKCQLTCAVHADQAPLFQRPPRGGPTLAPGGYDADAAKRLSAGVETAVNDDDRRREIMATLPERAPRISDEWSMTKP
jgi:hypothetical protein